MSKNFLAFTPLNNERFQNFYMLFHLFQAAHDTHNTHCIIRYQTFCCRQLARLWSCNIFFSLFPASSISSNSVTSSRKRILPSAAPVNTRAPFEAVAKAQILASWRSKLPAHSEFLIVHNWNGEEEGWGEREEGQGRGTRKRSIEESERRE